MAELAAGARLLAVQVEMRVRDLEHVQGLRHGADQVHHQRAPRLRRPERQPEDRPQVVLELARLGALDRPVAGVVHPRRDLVCQQLAHRRRRARARARRHTRARRGSSSRTPRPPPDSRSPRARATSAGSRPCARSRRAGRNASRRVARGRRSARARGRKRHVPRGRVRGQSPDGSPPDVGPFRRSRAAAS